MAERLTNIPTDIAEYPNSFKRQGAFPLEAYELFYSLKDAEDYAKEGFGNSGHIAYVGQTIKVVTDYGVDCYVIADTAGTLHRIGEGFDFIEVDGGGADSADPESFYGTDSGDENVEVVERKIGTIVEGVLIGDANGDGKVNTRDISVIQQAMNGWGTDIDAKAADVNDDGRANVRDIGLLNQYLNGWDV